LEQTGIPIQKNYFNEQSSGERDVLVALVDNDFAGYLTIKYDSYYQPFEEKRIPEIVDLNVLKKYQNKGIATKLMDKAEKIVLNKSDLIGIAVGLTKDYGTAQSLYVNRGYVPDKNGISQNGNYLKHGDKITVDDDLVLCFLKKLK
jgi:GNAT superfamily N-acetyltransferase